MNSEIDSLIDKYSKIMHIVSDLDDYAIIMKQFFDGCDDEKYFPSLYPLVTVLRHKSASLNESTESFYSRLLRYKLMLESKKSQ